MARILNKAELVDVIAQKADLTKVAAKEALEALLPLLDGTVRNLGDVGLPAALTGPVARGDVETVRGHVLAIGEAAPELLPAFVAASLMAVDVGIRKGTLAAPAADEIRKILAG